MIRPILLGLLVAGALVACDDASQTSPFEPRDSASFSLGLSNGATADTLAVGETVQLTSSLPKRKGKTTATATTWTSSAPAIATVSQTGLVTAVAAGSTTIRAANSLGSESATILVLATAAPAPVEPTAPATAPVVDTATATSPAPSPGSTAELPRLTVDTRLPAVTGRSIAVAAGGNLQAALDAAVPGDEIVLAAGATFVGNFKLPAKAGAAVGQWITVRSSGTLPAPGVRARASDAAQMARVQTANSAPALATAAGTLGWRLVGLDIGATPTNTLVYNLVALGEGSSALQTSLAQVPSYLVVDRSYIHGHAQLDVRRCIGLNSAHTAIIDSWVSECHSNQGDSQAIYGWNGPGPFRIENNHLEGGHEGLGFGGPTPGIAGLVPSDITIRRNHVIRPLAWRGVWTVKNLFEMKSGQRVLFEGNVLENNWADGQNGFAVLLQGLSDENTAPQNRIWDVTLRHNVIRNTTAGINLASRVAYNGALPTHPMTRVTIENNAVALNSALGGSAAGLQVLGDVQDLLVTHTTFLDVQGMRMSIGVLFDNGSIAPARGLRFVGNVFGPTAHCAVAGNGTLGALTTFARYAPDAVFAGNALVGDQCMPYPAGNYYAPDLVDAGIGRFAVGSLEIAGSPAYLAGAASVPGIDAASLAARTVGVVH